MRLAEIEEFVRRAQAAQQAVDHLTRLDVVATTGGKATVAAPLMTRRTPVRKRSKKARKRP